MLWGKFWKKRLFKNEFKKKIDVLALPFLLYCTTHKTFWLRAYKRNQPKHRPQCIHFHWYSSLLPWPSTFYLTVHTSIEDHILQRYVRTLHSMLIPCWQCQKLQLRTFSWPPLRLNPFYCSSKPHKIYRHQNSPSILYPLFCSALNIMFRIVFVSHVKTSTTLRFPFQANCRLK